MIHAHLTPVTFVLKLTNLTELWANIRMTNRQKIRTLTRISYAEAVIQQNARVNRLPKKK